MKKKNRIQVFFYFLENCNRRFVNQLTKNSGLNSKMFFILSDENANDQNSKEEDSKLVS